MNRLQKCLNFLLIFIKTIFFHLKNTILNSIIEPADQKQTQVQETRNKINNKLFSWNMISNRLNIITTLVFSLTMTN